MKKIFTSFLVMFLAITAMAQDLTYNVKSYCGKYYEGYTVTIDDAAVQAAIGCSMADASAFVVLPDGTESSNLLGGTDGWRNAEGAFQGWGAEAIYYVKADFSRESAQIYDMGGYPGNTGTPATYSAVYKLYNPADNSKSMKITINLNYVEIPVVNLSEYTRITPNKSISAKQYPRSNQTADDKEYTGFKAINDLGIDFTQNNIADFIFVKQQDPTTLMEKDTLILFESGSWFQPLCDEQGYDLEECAYDAEGMNEEAKFSLSNIYFENDTLWLSVAQNPKKLKENEKYKVILYVVNPDTKKYAQVNFTLEIEPNPIPEVPYKDMTEVGSQDFSCEQYPDNGYGFSSMSLDLEAIANALGTTVGGMEFKALANAEDFSSETTANNGGEWFDANGYVCAWGASATMFIEPATSGDYSIWHIGQYPDAFVADQSQTTSIFFVRTDNNTYYRINVTLNVIAKQITDLNECETVGNLTYEMQIIPSDAYQDDYMFKAIDVDIDYISSLLETSTPDLYGEIYNAETESFEYSDDQQSMDGCEQGFWMDICEYVVNKSSVGTWGSSAGNSYGIGWVSDGTFSFFQMPSTRAVGDTYTDNFYLVNLNAAKKVKIVITVSYVESRQESNVVGQSSYVIAASEDGEYTDIANLEEIYTAFGCDADEFDMAGELLAGKTTTTYVDKINGKYDDVYVGFPFGADGLLVDPEANPDDIVFYLGVEDGQFVATVMDEAILEGNKSFLCHLAFQYGDARYICNMTVTSKENADGIDRVVVKNVKDTNTYDLSGRLVNAPAKGLYIQNGKKIFVK